MTRKEKLDDRPNGGANKKHSDSKTVRYELEMLVGIAQKHHSLTIHDTDQVLLNACIESFAIHCRALIDFLFDDKVCNPYKTDVFAYNFYPDWQNTCPEPSELIKCSKERANKHIAHITTDRREVNQSGGKKESIWVINDVTKEILAIFEQFLKKAPPENFDPVALQKMNDLISEFRLQESVEHQTTHTQDSNPLPSSPLHARRDSQSTTPPIQPNTHARTSDDFS